MEEALAARQYQPHKSFMTFHSFVSQDIEVIYNHKMGGSRKILREVFGGYLDSPVTHVYLTT